MNFRFIPFKQYDPYFKTGMNRALMESVAQGAEAVVFLSGWDEKCINLGYSQGFEEEVNTHEFKEREDVLLVRRQGGGGATYLTPEGEITWGLVATEEYFPEDVNRVYSQVCRRIADGLEEIGIEAEHQPINDVVTQNGKISGATMKRENGAVYVGGTLLYEVDAEEMFSMLTPDENKLKDKQVEDFRDRVTSVRQETDAEFEEAVKALKKGLLTGKNFEISEFKEKEIKQARELANKYSSQEWLYRK